MKLSLRLGFLGLFVAVGLFAQDGAAIWKALSQPAFDPAKSTAVSNLTLARDRIRLTMLEGTLQFSLPVGGVVSGAFFQGRGRVQVAPPNAAEAQQLKLFTGQESLDLEFSDAVLSFSDSTFDEVGAAAKWTTAAGSRAAEQYLDRQQERENVGAELLPRLFKGILSGDRKRTALFAADLKTRDKGWIHVRHDALDLEEVSVGRWTNWGSSVHFDDWLRFPAGDLTAAQQFRDPLAREDFRIRGYRIDAAVNNAAELRATALVTLEHRAAGERVLLFELDANLRVESVRLGSQKETAGTVSTGKEGQGQALEFFQPRDPKDRNQSYGDYIAVVLPQPAQRGQPQTLEFRYAGKRVIRKVGAGNYFCQSFGWYPTRPNSFAARADFELNFRYPKRYTLVATGSKSQESNDGDISLSSWKSDVPLAVAGFAFGDYKIYNEKAGAIDIEIYANRQADDFMASLTRPELPGEDNLRAPLGSLSPSALAKTMGIEVANTVRLFEKYFGPYPYKRLAVTNIPYSYGQGWPALLYLSAITFLDSTQRNALGIKDHVQLTDFFRAHESSHQWWGHRVSWKSYHDQWLSEGFAQFSGNLYVQYRKNEKEYLTRLRQDKEELLTRDQRNRVYESLGPVWMGTRLASSDSPRGYATVVYNKGGYILHMLRMLLFDPRSKERDERFIAMMQEFCRTFENQPASTEDFKAVAEKYITPVLDLDGNQRLDWFFRQYVYGTGVPRYQFRYSVEDAGGGQWKIAATVTQSGVPEGWKDVLPLYAQTSGRTVRLGGIRVLKKEERVEFTLPLKPEKLLLNHFEDTLAEIRQ